MSGNEALALPQKPPTTERPVVNMTVREAIAKLAMSEDMDAELCFSFHNSDPIPVTEITDTGEGQVTLTHE